MANRLKPPWGRRARRCVQPIVTELASERGVEVTLRVEGVHVHVVVVAPVVLSELVLAEEVLHRVGGPLARPPRADEAIPGAHTLPAAYGVPQHENF
eukprot:632345-Prymnesium_polylepis.1